MELLPLAAHERNFPHWTTHWEPWVIAAIIAMIVIAVAYRNYRRKRE